MMAAEQKKFEVPGEGAWTFKNPEIACAFDAHVREQLPWYDLATEIVVHVARHVLPAYGLAIDVGASTGNIGRALAPVLEHRGADLIAIDSSPDMVAQYRGPGRCYAADATQFRYPGCDVVVSFLTLMFVPVHLRAALVARWKDALRPGGALIVFDKACADGELGTILYRLTLAMKRQAGADLADIAAKELSLAGVQRPINPVTDLVGFTEVFRFGVFGGWVWLKP